MIQKRFRLALLRGAVALSATVLLSQTMEQSRPDAPKSDEYLLLGNADRGAGEPFVFVNPKDSNNIIVDAMATLNRLPTGEAPIPRGQPGAIELRVKELSTPDGSLTDIAVTHDGGKTWTFSQDNFRKVLNKNRCSDSFAGAGPDGTLYMGCLAYLNRGSAAFADGYNPANGEAKNPGGGTAIAWSMDKGKTWSEPKYVHPLRSPQLYPPNLHPVFEQVSPVDRPYFAADAQTGTIYLSGTGSAYTVDPAIRRSHTFIRASHDQARTWGIIYPADSDDYPGGGATFSAAYGNLAVAYTAMKAPANLNMQCPCTVFGTSRDDGKTFEYRIVPALPGTPAPPAAGAPGAPAAGRGGRGGRGGRVMVAADPSNEGRYAIARNSGRTIMVSVTRDGGKTWPQPVVAAQLPEGVSFGQEAMKYSPKGDLALIWKAMYKGGERVGTNSQMIGSFDVWSALSRDGGSVFRTVRVSHAVSPPYILERSNFLFGDDLSSVVVDDNYVHVVWGDNRSGFEGTWYGQVPVTAY